MNISLKQLEIFVTIAECGNFTEAGRRLYLAQSTVSSHISALETALRVPLFQRESRRNVELTAEGKRIYEYARDVVSKCAALESSIAVETRRELVIGASTAPAKGLLPQQVLQFTKENPACCCVIRGGDSEQIQQMVLDGDVQIGFVGSTDNRQSLTYERVAEDRLVLITPNTPRFQALKARDMLGRDLLNEPLVFRDQGSGTQKMIDNYLSQREVAAARLNVRHYTSDPELLRELVALGAGVSIVSALSVADDVQAGKLLTFDLEETPVFRHIYMVYRKKGTLSELERAFLQQIRRTV